MSASKLQDYLSTVTVGELVRGKGELISVSKDAPIKEVLALMANYHVLSIPLKDGEKYTAIVDLLEIMTYVGFASYFKGPDGTAKPDLSKLNLSLPVEEVVGLSEEGKTLWVRKASEPLPGVLELLSKGVHRLLVEHEDKSMKLLTQTDVVRFLVARQDRAAVREMCEQTLQNARLVDVSGGKPPVSCTPEWSALDAFRKLYISDVSAVAVVNDKGDLVGNVSATDVRGLRAESIETVNKPVLEYLKLHSGGHLMHPITADPSRSTVGTVMAQMVAGRVHRVWVTEHLKPIGVVSMTDIMSKFSPFDYK
jgi:CBS domain-containing protein